MVTDAFQINHGLLSATRLPAWRRLDARISAAELLLLLLAGTTAALATGVLRLGLRIPGNAIVLAIVPMTLGLALVPRRLAGVVMSGSALATAGALNAGGTAGFGLGAMTSLCLIGPMMDAAVARATPGVGLYLRILAAGLITNLAAFSQRGTAKLFALDGPGARLFDGWFSQALVTYTLSGAVAGLLGAFCWFQFRARPSARPGVDGAK